MKSARETSAVERATAGQEAPRPEARAAAGHAPRVGRLRRLLGPLYFTGAFWYRLSLLAVRLLPEFLVRPTVFVSSLFFFLILGHVRRALVGNLDVALGPAGRWARLRRGWRTLHTYSWCLFERYERFATERPFESRMEGRDVWDAIQASPQGVVFSTAHIGSWEFASTLATGPSARPVHLVREEELDPRGQRVIRELVEKHAGGGYRTHFASGDPSLGAKLMTALREGAMVALQGDRPRRGGRFLEARVFGRRLPLPPGPAALARSAGVSIVPVFSYREGRRRNVIVLRPPITASNSADRMADIAYVIHALGREIEDAIRREPNQWFCFADAFLPES